MTDGDDNACILNANAAVIRADKLGIPLYSVLEGEAMNSPKLKKELAELSEHTGGVAYQVRKLDEIDGVFEALLTICGTYTCSATNRHLQVEMASGARSMC